MMNLSILNLFAESGIIRGSFRNGDRDSAIEAIMDDFHR